jgi:pyruvate kinase
MAPLRFTDVTAPCDAPREPVNHEEFRDIRQELEAIRGEMLDAEQRFLSNTEDIPDRRRISARNLLHYLALRRRDLRLLQWQLAKAGLSSLGRAESQALANVQAVLGVLHRLVGNDSASAGHLLTPFDEGRALLDLHTHALFGPPPPHRDVRIMVTMPTEAAYDGRLLRDLVTSGMDCMRINAAHDDTEAWTRMLHHLAAAKRETGKACRVLVDLAGPKLRTGAVEAGPAIVRWRPQRDAYGRVTKPARVWLTSVERPAVSPDTASATLPVSGAWLAELEIGETITLVDARDKKRALTVSARADGGVWAESEQSAYVLSGTRLRVPSGDGRREIRVGDLPPTPQSIVLKPGDTLLLSRDGAPGHGAVCADDGQIRRPAVIGVTLSEIFDDVQPGEAIWFDDGRIGGVIRAASSELVEVSITHAKPTGSKLSADKGINLPDTNLRLPALVPKDLDDLRFVVAQADIVGYSFVRTAEDVRELQSHLAEMGRTDLGLILKIETRRAFEHLPGLLLAAMRSPASGVMIARGDLAVECGYERLAEIQEEILWMAEASHTPVIWATQVLESLAKSGIPSRAEITDAAMGERAECVMLNKGPYIVDAVRALDNILTRMQDHQRKKSAMLRPLGLADRFLNSRLA